MQTLTRCTSAAPSLIPDPRLELDSELSLGGSSKRLLEHRRVSARIYSVVREMIGDVGLDNVHIQAIADRSGVSVQSLYNIVGGRTELIGGAATQWVMELVARSEVVAQQRGVNPIVGALEMFWTACVTQTSYSSGLVCSKAIDKVLHDRCAISVERRFLYHLRNIEKRRGLDHRANPRVLARQLAFCADSCVRDWVGRPYGEREFRQALVDSGCFMLRGAVRGEELGRIEKVLDQSALT